MTTESEWTRTARRVGAALREAPARAGRTRVLAVDGRSGAGKTAFAALLRAELGAQVLACEDLYGGWDGLDRGISLLVSAVLAPLAACRPVRLPRYDWVAEAWAEPVALDPPELLIVEGVGTGARPAAAFESLVTWLEAPQPIRRKRALDRDGDTYAPHWDQWAAQEEAMLAREHTPARADIIINGVTGAITQDRLLLAERIGDPFRSRPGDRPP